MCVCVFSLHQAQLLVAEMPSGHDSYGVREYPPPCRHTKALTNQDLKIRNLETEVKRLQEHDGGWGPLGDRQAPVWEAFGLISEQQDYCFVLYDIFVVVFGGWVAPVGRRGIRA